MATVLDIDDIVRDGATQPRERMDEGVVSDYADALKGGASFPPVTVYLDRAGLYHLADGFHRVAAHRREGRGAISAEVIEGERRDAVLHSVGANAEHGLRRTNADKKRAVCTLLRDDEWRMWSDAEIARRTRVSDKTVARHRAELVASSEIPRMDVRRVERDGVVYEQDVSGQREAAAARRAEVEAMQAEADAEDVRVSTSRATRIVTGDEYVDEVPDDDAPTFDPDAGFDSPEGETQYEAEAEVGEPAPTDYPMAITAALIEMADLQRQYIARWRKVERLRKQGHAETGIVPMHTRDWQALNRLNNNDRWPHGLQHAAESAQKWGECPRCGGGGCNYCERLGWITIRAHEAMKKARAV